MKYPLRLIEWHDAYSGDHVWTRLNELPDHAPAHSCSTIGFEVSRDDKHVTLAMTIGPEDAGDDRAVINLHTIPLGMIIREQTFRRRSLSEEIARG